MHKLFAYGIINLPHTQQWLFGQTKEGKPDAIVGLNKYHGQNKIFMAVPEESAVLGGKVYELSDDDLRMTDQLEGCNDKGVGRFYTRKIYKTINGEDVWVYVRP